MAPTILPQRLTRAQQEMVEKALPLVQRVARFLRRTALPTADREELVAWGRLGLVEAALTYDPQFGSDGGGQFPFETFAWTRVRGAMLDNAEGAGLLSRNAHRRRVRKLVDDTAILHDQLGSVYETDEDSMRRIRHATADAGTVCMVDWALVTDVAPTPEAELCLMRLKQAIKEIEPMFTPEQRVLFDRRFREDCTLREIGVDLAVPYSTLRRHFRELLDLVRFELAKRGFCDSDAGGA